MINSPDIPWYLHNDKRMWNIFINPPVSALYALTIFAWPSMGPAPCHKMEGKPIMGIKCRRYDPKASSLGREEHVIFSA